MTWRRGRATARAGVALLAVSALALGPAVTASAQIQPKTYEGAHFTSDYTPFSPTRAESQHKLWFHAGTWWALMLDPTGRTERVYQLLPDHTWHPTSAVISTDTAAAGDAVQDGESVHVVQRSKNGLLYYLRLTFDPAAKGYRVVVRTLVPVHPSVAPVSVARDSAGVLWVSWVTATRMVATYSTDGGHTWARTLVLADAGNGKSQEASAMVAYDDRIGILWSNQTVGAFEFASHRAGDDPAIWSHEKAISGPAAADNHISLVRVRQPGQTSDTLVAAVKTSMGDHGEVSTSPLIEVLTRTPAGHWSASTAGTVADGLDDPVLQVDQATKTLHLFASRDGAIVMKTAPLTDPRFTTGTGSLFINGINANLYDPTGTADPVTAQSGLVVLASDLAGKTYRHGELALGAPVAASAGPDKTPPSTPPHLAARAVSPDTTVVSWSPSTDGNQWVPGGNGVPVSKYLVLRNGKQVASLTATSFEDRPRSGTDTAKPASVQYQVVAVDAAGNRSPAAGVVVELPAASNHRSAVLIGLALLGLAALAGVYVLWRAWLRHQVAARDHLRSAGAHRGTSVNAHADDARSAELSSHR